MTKCYLKKTFEIFIFFFFQCQSIMAKGNFTLHSVITALDNNAGNEEASLLELQKDQLKPFLMRIWGPPTGVENEEAAPMPGYTYFYIIFFLEIKKYMDEF